MIPPALETYLDGLGAVVNGRGYGAEHERARVYVENAVRAHDELVAALEDILICEKNRRADLATLSMRPKSIYEFSNKRVKRAESALAKARGEE